MPPINPDPKREGRSRGNEVSSEDFLFHLYRGSELLQDNRVDFIAVDTRTIDRPSQSGSYYEAGSAFGPEASLPTRQMLLKFGQVPAVDVVLDGPIKVFDVRGLRDVASLIKAPIQDVPARLESLMEDRKRLERELAEAKKKLAMGGGGSAGDAGLRTVGDIKLLARSVQGIEMKDLKSLADEGKKQIGSGVVAIVGVNA